MKKLFTRLLFVLVARLTQGRLSLTLQDNGLFIQFTSEAVEDIPIPDKPGREASSISFGVLKLAQALGDQQALIDAGRRVIRFDLGTDPIGMLQKFVKDITHCDQ